MPKQITLQAMLRLQRSKALFSTPNGEMKI